ncbi:MAG: hypothetical protein WAU56_18060 [Steroidobacteraceae bacterium]
MLNWAYFPRSAKPVALAIQVVEVFRQVHEKIASEQHRHSSNAVLQHVAEGLKAVGFSVEVGKKKSEKIYVPVLYGNNGKVAKAYEADAHHVPGRFVVEIEAGRATINNQFLKDLFQACLMDEVEYAAIAVRNIYEAAGIRNPDFDRVVTFFETLYASDRIRLPLKGILLIGY